MKHYFLIPILLVTLLLSCSKEDSAEANQELTGVTANQQPTGTSSNHLLSDAVFSSMVVELVYVEGFKPTQTAINNFVNFLEERTYKPNGITVVTRSIVSPGMSSYTTQDIINIENANRTKYNTEDQIAVWAFFADGQSANNTANGVVLGTAYRNTSFVIYEETLHSYSDSAFEANRDVLETTVITHEFGHILGLTNLGAAMQTNHEDTEHPKHCNDEDCLMYWSAETGSGMENLIGVSTAPQLDSQCIADLQANGGK